MAGNLAFIPAVGQHRVLVIDTDTWQQQAAIDVHGQPVFVMARPDGRHFTPGAAAHYSDWLLRQIAGQR